MKRYNPKEIEPRWQEKWVADKIYEASDNTSKPKRYVLEYFPYPSGAAMHVGHVRNYAIGDAISRHARMSGYNVLHPMGWDAFGLPAENYAIKTGTSPERAIAENTSRFKQQLVQMGFDYDWSREITSSEPEYYRWTQWFFLLLFKRGLAYQKESLQWWCPVDKTVLANEQVENGQCWRCGSEVEKKALKQWFFKITDYADRLAKDLDDVNWSDSIKSMQRNWIGRSSGAEIDFKIDGSDQKLTVFTTRPDTLYGATFMVVAPEHPIVMQVSTGEHREHVGDYIKLAQSKSDIERQETNREKTGVFTGAYAINPINSEKIPVWVADYVLYGYGTGAIMAVPAHDERDFAFAKKFDLPIRQVVAPELGVKRENEQFADGGSSVVFDPKTQCYAFLRIDNTDRTALFAGGTKDGETIHEGILRELREESGLTHIKHYEEVCVVYGHYYHSLKKLNRRAKATVLLVVLEDTDVVDTQLEAHETFHLEWLNPADVLAAWQATDGGHYDHYIVALKQAVARAIELGYDTTSDPHVFASSALSGEGVMVNSGAYDEMDASDAREKIVADLAAAGTGKERVNYKIRDWLISRQRYWGAPIPMIHCEKDGTVAVPEDQLPVVLPELTSFEPSGDGRSPLARVPEFVNTTCPKCGGPAQRETDTMDGFACSSWYFLRFADPHNNAKPFDADKGKYWLPVDDYIGGAEHAVMHLLYARMWTKVMQDEGLIDFGEPFKTLRNHGMILAPDGAKMSKSKGNTIEPDTLIEQGYGADSIRIMELFIGPWNQTAAWSVEGMGGSFRFLQRVWALGQDVVTVQGEDKADAIEIKRILHRTTKKVSEDLQALSFNTAIAAMMQAVNDLYAQKATLPFDQAATTWRWAIETLVQLLAPFAPHITEELWAQLGHSDSVHTSRWPVHDEQYLVNDTMTIAVQVNGRIRGQVEVPAAATQDQIVEAAKAHQKVATYVSGKEIRKTIYIPGKLVSFVV
ncbi:MAG TPA: leucine--tRNA ligase [Patescibacteria group bacterium]|nr:leucine--tRNA ligase [Patescibacteria group bacterium]